MMASHRLIRTGAVLILMGSASAQAFELRRPVTPSSASTEIVGGQIASVAKYPATWIFRNSAGEPCTATAIGPRVLALASHCLKGEMTGKFADHPISIRCEQFSKPANGYDVAFCSTSATIPIKSGQPYESIRLEKAVPDSTWLTLVGFGCTKAGGATGVLYEGASSVSGGNPPMSFKTKGGAALCAGDSGSGAYWLDPDQNRWVVGIASETLLADGVSSFSSMQSGALAKWIREWKTRQVDAQNNPIEVKICGMDGPTTVCSG
jgi:hypothetical protein